MKQPQIRIYSKNFWDIKNENNKIKMNTDWSRLSVQLLHIKYEDNNHFIENVNLKIKLIIICKAEQIS